MKAKEVHNMDIEDLEKKLNELQQELFNLRFQNAVGQLENPMRIRNVRKDIARIKTVLHSRSSVGA